MTSEPPVVIEVLDVPSGAGLRRYQRVPVPSSFSIGGPGAQVVLPSVSAASRWSFDASTGFTDALGAVMERTDPYGLITLELETARVVLRVLDASQPPLRWPGELLDGIATKATPGLESQQVLGDVLLEGGHPLGARFRGLDDAHDESWWLAHLALARDSGALDVTWSHGVASAAVLRGELSWLASFPHHALLHVLQRLELVPSNPAAAVEGLEVLSEGTLPWLTRLTIHGVTGAAARRAQSAFSKHSALRRCLPRLPSLTFTSGAISTVKTPEATQPFGPQHVVMLEAPDTFLRFWAGAPCLMLGAARAEVSLNGVVRRRPGPGPWLLPMAVTDVVELGARRITFAS